MHNYQCPCCNSRLKKDFYHGKVCFKCPECRGVFATLPVIRALCGNRNFANSLWMKSRSSYESRLYCPVCRKPMKLVRQEITPENVLELDICHYCQEIWFDAGELEAIPLKIDKAPEQLPPKAREILAMEQIKNVRADGDDEDYSPSNPWQTLAGAIGFPVEINAPQLHSLPLVTWAFAALCILFFTLSFNDPEVVKNWGMIPNDLFRNYGANVFTSIFLHGGIWHLAGNIYFLLVFGDNVEDYLGKVRYLLLIAASVLFSFGAYLLLHSNSAVPCIGASGVISGIIAVYAILFPGVRLNFLISRSYRYYRPCWVQVPAAAAFVFWVIFQVIMVFAAESSLSGGVAYSAHIGGALCGITYGVILSISAHKCNAVK